MKYIITSDWHITDQPPKRRTDDYVKEQIRKINYIVSYSCRENMDILNCGDIFHTKKISYETLRTMIQILSKTTMIGVFGQHDMRYHSNDKMDNTPLAVLESAKVFISSRTDFCQEEKKTKEKIYFCNFGETIPKVEDTNLFNILIYHGLICFREEVPNSMDAVEFLNANSFYDLIVTGDNHKTFTVQNGSRMLINPGSLMRMDITQVDHKPCFFVYDTQTLNAKRVEIPVKDNVFDLSLLEKEKEINRKLEAFVNGLSEDKIMENLKFENNLENFMVANNIENCVKELVNKLIAELNKEAI